MRTRRREWSTASSRTSGSSTKRNSVWWRRTSKKKARQMLLRSCKGLIRRKLVTRCSWSTGKTYLLFRTRPRSSESRETWRLTRWWRLDPDNSPWIKIRSNEQWVPPCQKREAFSSTTVLRIEHKRSTKTLLKGPIWLNEEQLFRLSWKNLQ